MRISIHSTPRSGNTWLGIILTQLYELDALAFHDPAEIDWLHLPNRCVLQLHWEPTEDLLIQLRKGGFCSITIARHPLDTLLSILHFCHHEPQTDSWLLGEGGNESEIFGKSPDSEEFLRYALSDRAQALLAITPEWIKVAHSQVVRYEQLVHEPEKELRPLLDRLPPPHNPLHKVLQEANIDKLRSQCKNHHFWKGRPGHWKTLLPPKTADAIHKRHSKVFDLLEYPKPGDYSLDLVRSREAWKQISVSPTNNHRQPDNYEDECPLLVSHAQNGEDIVLSRALKEIEQGFYLDIGANDPEIDSVSKAFYDAGWNGINLEPSAEYHDKLCRQRPRDLNLQLAASDSNSPQTLYIFPDTGLSTTQKAIAEIHKKQGLVPIETTTPCITLDELFQLYIRSDVHFLKIDVEGSEAQVLNGLDLNKHRPWIVVVEATKPLSQEETHQDWEKLLTKNGYFFTYFDGINRFYLADEHANLATSLQTPPNFFDHFQTAREQRLEISLDNANLSFAELEARYNDMGTRYNDLGTRYNDLGTRYNDLGTRYNDLEARYNDLEARYNDLEAHFNNGEEHIRFLEKQYALAEKRIRHLEDQLTLAEKKSDRQQSEISKLNDYLLAANERILNLAQDERGHLYEITRLRHLIYSASTGKHLYRAFKVLLGDKHYKQPKSTATLPK